MFHMNLWLQIIECPKFSLNFTFMFLKWEYLWTVCSNFVNKTGQGNCAINCHFCWYEDGILHICLYYNRISGRQAPQIVAIARTQFVCFSYDAHRQTSWEGTKGQHTLRFLLPCMHARSEQSQFLCSFRIGMPPFDILMTYLSELSFNVKWAKHNMFLVQA